MKEIDKDYILDRKKKIEIIEGFEYKRRVMV